MNAAAAFVAVLGARQPFNPVTSLFAHGEQGVVLDPSDLSTLYQDSAGTTPVTAVEQAVGLILDKSGRGNHAIQPGATNRPILRSRYNQLTYSEDFSNAAWAKAGASTVTGTNTLNFPNTNEAISQSRTMYAVPGVSATFSVVLSGTGTITIGIARQAGGTYEQTISQVTLTATPTRYSVARALVNSGHDGFVGFITRAAASGDTATTVTATQADLRFTVDTYLPYQRIAAATDYDTVGFPVYLAFDGSDDSLYTSSIDFSATDKMTVFAGVTKLSDSAFQTIAETSANADSNNGAFSLLCGTTNGDASRRTWGSLIRSTDFSLGGAAVFASPITSVLTGAYDFAQTTAATENVLRVDGAQQSMTFTGAADCGTANFGNYALNIGRRNNATLPLNGRLYSLVVRGAQTSAALIQQAERWVAGKQGRAL